MPDIFSGEAGLLTGVVIGFLSYLESLWPLHRAKNGESTGLGWVFFLIILAVAIVVFVRAGLGMLHEAMLAAPPE